MEGLIDLVAAKCRELDRESRKALQSPVHQTVFGESIPEKVARMRLNTSRRPISLSLDRVLGFQLAPAPILRRRPTPHLLRVADFQTGSPAPVPRKAIRGRREAARHLKQRSGL